MADVSKESLALHLTHKGKIETKAKIDLSKRENIALAYTPGVGAVSSYLASHPEEAGEYSLKGNSVAVISDGSAVLGLGNIGPYGALPVMEGKALIFKEFAGIDAWPIVLATQDPDEIVATIKAIAPSFAGINLEDIASPKCFDIERRLIEELPMPVMHDDQHGTAIVVLAGLINAAKVVQKEIASLRVVVLGAGAAGTAVASLLVSYSIPDVIVVDRKGIVSLKRNDLYEHKKALATLTNPRGVDGTLSDALKDADVVIGLSGPALIRTEEVKSMAREAIVFALSNPVPEIMPEEARMGGATVIATGRSDFPNQINNALVFPGVFQGALTHSVRRITEDMKLRAAEALAALVAVPTADCIIPDILDERVVPAVAGAIQIKSEVTS